MKISELQLTNFKRFTDLTIKGIPADNKLVLLIGANGSGKSSVFDAFNYALEASQGFPPKRIGVNSVGLLSKEAYLRKQIDGTFEISLKLTNHETLVLSENRTVTNVPQNSFYGRTSFRQISRLTRTSFGQGKTNTELDEDRSEFFIDKDERLENDIEKVTEWLLKEGFRSDKSVREIAKQYIYPINQAFQHIFDYEEKSLQLELVDMIPPLDEKPSQLTFKKGLSEFHYNLLSAGEKEVFNILFNLLVRREYYQDTIYYFDELDLHLNTQPQFNLLKEITENWIPENCQLWTASHSLGFIEYAKKSEQAVVVDFDNLDFDIPQTIFPSPKESTELYEIAVSKDILPSLFKDMTIVFVEGKDENEYGSILVENTLFVSGGNKDSVFYKHISGNYAMIDRDFLSDDDIEQIYQHYPKLIILELYCIENYLFHPKNLEEYYKVKGNYFNKEDYIYQIKVERDKVRRKITAKISSTRNGYKFFKEEKFDKKIELRNKFMDRNENHQQTELIIERLESDDFELFYPFFSMKSYAGGVQQRQHIAKTDLAKTNWFRNQIAALIQKRKMD